MSHYTYCNPTTPTYVTAVGGVQDCVCIPVSDVLMCVRVCAGMFGNVDAVRSWVASGADINVVDGGGFTPLMEAAHRLHTECVAEMLRLGADACRVNSAGMTALHLVAAWADPRGDVGGVVRQLVVAGCDAAMRVNHGRTAVEVARDRYGNAWASKIDGWVAEYSR